MIVAIQQPEHLPWIGFFDKMLRCDVFVLLDSVQFKRRYFENRNRVRTADGSRWITVPVRSRGRFTQRIDSVEIDDERPWRRKYWGTIEHAYSRAPHFDAHAGELRDLLNRDRKLLVELNVAMIEHVRGALDIGTRMERSSAIADGDETGSDLILRICRDLGATTYVSGPDGARYLDTGAFADAGIALEYHDFQHPEYRQLHAPFLSHMSVVDLIFNHGPGAREIVRGTAR